MSSNQQSQDVDPFAAVEPLREALGQAGRVLPSLRAEVASSGPHLVELGRVRAEAATLLATVIRRGNFARERSSERPRTDGSLA